MISSLQGSKTLVKGTYLYLQNGPNALIFDQFGVLIIRTMAVPLLNMFSRHDACSVGVTIHGARNGIAASGCH